MSHTQWPDLSDQLFRPFTGKHVSHKHIYIFLYSYALHNLLHFISLCVVWTKVEIEIKKPDRKRCLIYYVNLRFTDCLIYWWVDRPIDLLIDSFIETGWLIDPFNGLVVERLGGIQSGNTEVYKVRLTAVLGCDDWRSTLSSTLNLSASIRTEERLQVEQFQSLRRHTLHGRRYIVS